MQELEYLANPCSASSLPFWKTERMRLPETVTVIRDDCFSGCRRDEVDEQYFKLMHDLKTIAEPAIPEGFGIDECGLDDYVQHINSCYSREHITVEELQEYRSHPVYRQDLWIAVADSGKGGIVATGIAELDARIGEGILEWIQVSPGYRHMGLGSYLVCELLKRMREEARFVTVSGRLESESDPFRLYRSCGFKNPVIWHIVRKKS